MNLQKISIISEIYQHLFVFIHTSLFVPLYVITNCAAIWTIAVSFPAVQFHGCTGGLGGGKLVVVTVAKILVGAGGATVVGQVIVGVELVVLIDVLLGSVAVIGTLLDVPVLSDGFVSVFAPSKKNFNDCLKNSY